MNKPLKILIVSTAHEEGTGAYVMLSEFLKACRDQLEIQPVVLCPPTGLVADAVKQHQIPVVWLNTTRDALLQNFRSCLSVMPYLQNMDCVLAWHSRGFELSLVLSKKLRCPFMAILHDPPDSPVHSRLRKGLMRMLITHARPIVAVSHAVAASWHGIVPPGCITVIHNGIHRLPMSLQKVEATDHQVLKIGFLGGGSVTKGLALVLQSAQNTEDLSVVWNIYGKVKEPIVSGPNVVFKGVASRESIFQNIDLLVHASTTLDPYPTVLLEAASCGIPVVASDLGGAVEIVENGVTGFLFSPQNPSVLSESVRRLVLNPDKRNQMGCAAMQRFERDFSIDTMMSAYIKLFQSLT